MPIITELIKEAESAGAEAPSQPVATNSVVESLSETIRRDPYNVRARTMRGQTYFAETKRPSARKYRQAIADFEKAANIDQKLADSRFGLGTVYYELALSDLAKRGKHTVRKKGTIAMGRRGLLEETSPDIDLYPDDRNRLVLQAALDEFQAGKRLKQDFSNSFALYNPQQIDERIRGIRTLLGFEPHLYRDDQLNIAFSFVAARFEQGGIWLFFDKGDKE